MAESGKFASDSTAGLSTGTDDKYGAMLHGLFSVSHEGDNSLGRSWRINHASLAL
jgi:hypothetical protein